jgi:hypothetical protein
MIHADVGIENTRPFPDLSDSAAGIEEQYVPGRTPFPIMTGIKALLCRISMRRSSRPASSVPVGPTNFPGATKPTLPVLIAKLHFLTAAGRARFSA